MYSCGICLKYRNLKTKLRVDSGERQIILPRACRNPERQSEQDKVRLPLDYERQPITLFFSDRGRFFFLLLGLIGALFIQADIGDATAL